MRKAVGILVLCAFGWTANAAEDAPVCDQAAYVPGVDVHGKAVAPADATPTVTAQIDSFAIVKPRTRRRDDPRDPQVGVHLDGLERAVNPVPCSTPARTSPRVPAPEAEGK